LAPGPTLFPYTTLFRSSAQARLARIARDGEMRIDGSPVSAGFRLVASAPTGIDAEVHAQRFRADLHRRLCALRIDLPLLRERPEDRKSTRLNSSHRTIS